MFNRLNRNHRTFHFFARRLAVIATASLAYGLVCAGDCPGPKGMVYVPADKESGFGTGFWMDRHEVTNREFARFVAATGYKTDAERPGPSGEPAGAAVFVRPSAPVMFPRDIRQWWQFVPGANWRNPEGPGSSTKGREDHPVVNVSFNDAMAYARWKQRDLPTESEWEYAARGGVKALRTTEEWAYDANGKPRANTWQGFFPQENTALDGFVGTAPVGSFPPNGYGLFDMVGNVWEWTKDDSSDAVGPIRGGSYLCSPGYCGNYHPAGRSLQERDFGTTHIGFRTILRCAAARQNTHD
jgi:formylglycine-generating enzyme required for sulfatase activity